MLRTPIRYAILTFFILSGCASPLKTDTVSFMMPQSYQNSKEVDGLNVAINPIDSEEKSEEIFGTDMKTADILPIQLIVHNTGMKEFEINHQQIFGVTANQEYTVAYTLNKAATHVRNSSIGTTAVTGAVVGALAGAAIGAGVGAGIGHASGDTGKGAEAGAIIGGTEGTAIGLGAGLSDSFTVKFKRELANLAFEDRVIFPGDMQQGFIYLKWKPYKTIRVKIFNINDNKIYDLQFDVNVKR